MRDGAIFGIRALGYASKGKGKGKAVPLHAWSGPEGSRKLRLRLNRTSSHGMAMKDCPNSIEVDAETKENTRKTEEKLDGRNKEGHERKKPK